MAQVLTFPKELEHHLFGDADKNFLLTWLVLFVAGFSLTYWGSLQPLKVISREDIIKYQEVSWVHFLFEFCWVSISDRAWRGAYKSLPLEE